MSSVNIVDVGVSRILGSRVDQEDRYIALTPGSLKSRKDLALFAVYDGHGGAETVNHVQQNLATQLEAHFSVKPKASTPEEYKGAIQLALKAVDRELDIAGASGGSTVALALIDTKQGLLIEADLGDSHIVFANHQPQSPVSTESGNGNGHGSRNGSIAATGWDIERLSVEHAPASPEERRRVEAAGGKINYATGIARIGGVSMSRALGDIDYKLPRINRLAGHDLSDLGVETGVAAGRTVTQDLVSNKAHFSVRNLNGQSLILLASDGVGDAQDAEEVTRLAVERCQQGVEAKEIAEEITRREGKMKGADNCTVVVVVLDTDGKSRRSVDSGRRSLDVPMEGSGSRRRRRSSIASLKDWMRV